MSAKRTDVGGLPHTVRMTERVELWWERRQWSKGREIPYRIGRFRSDWERYPVLVRQYHPDLNGGITLTQVPPAAEVYLVWECDSGHRFVATPEEQRQRPGRSRRRSTWCPECAALAQPRRPSASASAETITPVPVPVPLECGHPRGTSRRASVDRPDRCLTCYHARAAADRVEVGVAFHSPWAPKPASAAEADLRQRLDARLDVDLGFNAVRVPRSFFHHLEVWPDIVIPELRVALEYDTTGRDGLEHVGRREDTDRRKDRMLRAVHWEVVRVRCGKLRPLGPHDVTASGVSDALVERLLDALREIRGDLIVNSYLRLGVTPS